MSVISINKNVKKAKFKLHTKRGFFRRSKVYTFSFDFEFSEDAKEMTQSEFLSSFVAEMSNFLAGLVFVPTDENIMIPIEWIYKIDYTELHQQIFGGD